MSTPHRPHHSRRREFLRAGAAAAAVAARPRCASAAAAAGDRRRLHLHQPRRRPEPPRHVRPEAGRPERRPRPVPPDPHARAGHAPERAVPEAGGDGGQVLPDPVDAPHGPADPRDRVPTAEHRPALPRRPRVAERRGGGVVPLRRTYRELSARSLLVRLPDAQIDTGVSVSHGQGVGSGPRTGRRDHAGTRRDTAMRTTRSTAVRQNCGRRPRCSRLRGRFVTVNMFATVFDAAVVGLPRRRRVARAPT